MNEKTQQQQKQQKQAPPSIQIISDLHLVCDCSSPFFNNLFEKEFHLNCVPNIVPQAKYLALLGDICVLTSEGANYLYLFLQQISVKGWKHIFVICGNHEFYNCPSVTEGFEMLKQIESKLNNVSFLEKSTYDLENGYRLLGTTLWSSIPKDKEQIVSNSLNDYHVCTVLNADRTSKRRMTVQDTNTWHQECVKWIENELLKAANERKKVIVLTHHAPIPNANPYFEGDPINCAFETDLTGLIHNPIVAWFWGHTHSSQKMIVNEILVQSNQYGYKDGKDCGFDPSFTFPLI